MDAAFERRSLQAFDAVLDQPDEDRERWIAEQYSTDPELLIALRRLLDTDRKHAQALPTAVPQAGRLAPEMTPPARVGVWRLMSCLGRGGMGQVYLGERDDGLFEQKVAIKLMAPGLFPAAATQLFDNERRVLARLRHPHIAQIYDGGVTPEDKLPFFAMELVEGEPIDSYCVQRDLPVAETLRLFLDACDAVQHAHQNLVVHADLKPSNIHVDRAGQVKLLDFGIARLVEQGADLTQDLPQPLTPAYASPSRQAGEPATPADDVYSLGVVLFELLAGVRPDSLQTTASQAVLSGNGFADFPLRRRRARVLRGDLDAIAARAIAASPQNRYPSVDALVTDLERWRKKLPVAARADEGWTYRARKFLVRNRLGVSIGGVAMSGLSLALAITTQLYLRAEAARTVAEQRFDDVRSLSRFMLFDLFDSLAAVPGTSTIRRDIADAGRGYLERLAADPDAPIAVRFDVADGYSRLGHIKAMMSTVGTGDLEIGRRDLERAERLLRELAAAAPERSDFTLELAKTLTWQASVVRTADNDFELAQKLGSEALALFDVLLARSQGDPTVRFWRWNAQLGQAERLYELREYAQIIALFEETLRAAEEFQPPEALTPLFPLLLATTHQFLGHSRYFSGDVAGSLLHYEKELATLRASPLFARDVRYIARAGTARYNVASVLQELRRLPEALALLDEGLAQTSRALAFESSPRLESAYSGMATTRLQILSELGRHGEAIAQMRDDVASRERRAAEHPADYELARHVAYAYRPLGEVYARAEMHAESCSAYRSAEQEWKALERMSPPSAHDVANEIALLARLMKDC
ncbi:MAG: protein kinase domain-containing protein [Panacagrimonas sp.]